MLRAFFRDGVVYGLVGVMTGGMSGLVQGEALSYVQQYRFDGGTA